MLKMVAIAVALCSFLIQAADRPTLPRVGVDIPGLVRGFIIQLAPVAGLAIAGYTALMYVKRALKQTQYYILFESKSERKARVLVERDWERAAKEDRLRAVRKNRQIEKAWRRALWEDERRARKNMA